MNNQLTVIPAHQFDMISGGHPELSTTSGVLRTADNIIYAIALTHVFMGVREFTNYAVDRVNNGCDNIEEGDHFTQFFADLYKHYVK